MSPRAEGSFQISRSPGVHSKNRRRSRFSVNHAHLQDGLNIAGAEVFSQLIAKQLHVMRAAGEFRGGFSPVASDTGQDDDPTVGCNVAIPGHQSVIVGARIGTRGITLPANLRLYLVDNR